MPSLVQILREHSPLLLVDAASDTIRVGLLSSGKAPAWASRKSEAGVGIFECLDDLGADVNVAGSFAYCEGPGSILGVRTAAMTLRVWNALRDRPTFSYFSLALLAESVPAGTAVVADARRGLWHRFADGRLGRVGAAELAGPLVTPDSFRHWEALPAGARPVAYDVSLLLAQERAAGADLFRPSPSPDAFVHQEAAYAKWTPRIHRAP